MDHITTLFSLFRYKASENDRMLTAMRQFPDGSPAKEIAFRIVNHTFVVDRIFAANLRKTAHEYASPNDTAAATLEELSGAIRSSDQWYIDYVSSLDREHLAEPIDFSFTDGKPGRMSREEMLMHLITHGGGHRAQIGLLMMQNAIASPEAGFTTYLHQAEAAERRRG